MTSSPNEHEAATAKEMLRALLFTWSLTEADVQPIIDATDDDGRQKQAGPSIHRQATDGSINAFDLNAVLIDDHVTIDGPKRTAVALWILHTYVFQQFRFTPRLAITSPVEECGKTTLLDVLRQTCAMPWWSDDPSPATIYHERDDNPDSTFLLDEGDNLGLFDNESMRRLFNAGHKQGGSTDRHIKGENRKFNLFGPLAIGAIGDLPRPLMSRSIEIGMQRQPPGTRKRPIDDQDPAWGVAQTVNYTFGEMVKSGSIVLNPTPDMPKELSNRAADNWRVLIAIADALGHGTEAREAAIALSARRPQDIRVIALEDTRIILDQRGTDRIWTSDLYNALPSSTTMGRVPWRKGRRRPSQAAPGRAYGDAASLRNKAAVRTGMGVLLPKTCHNGTTQQNQLLKPAQRRHMTGTAEFQMECDAGEG
jgi:hypothetical protein